MLEKTNYVVQNKSINKFNLSCKLGIANRKNGKNKVTIVSSVFLLLYFVIRKYTYKMQTADNFWRDFITLALISKDLSMRWAGIYFSVFSSRHIKISKNVTNCSKLN